MKKLLFLICVCFLTACDKDNPLEKYEATYSGQKVAIVSYNDYDPTFNQFVSMAKFDTTICKLDVLPNGDKVDIKEFNENNTLLKYWRGVEINNIGELAYFGKDTVCYGSISVDSFYYKIQFASPIPPDNIVETSDTLFYTYYFSAIKQ